MRAIQLLGARCACCSESHISFLDIDHIHGGGSRERRGRGPNHIFREILGGLPNPHEKYQVLCSNCNQSKRRRGRCEHESEREARKIG